MPIKSFAVVRSDRRGMIRNLTKEAPVEPAPLFFFIVSPYQITGRTESGLTIGSPDLHPNAAANCGMLDNGPFALH